jgi:hypothetical protein
MIQPSRNVWCSALPAHLLVVPTVDIRYVDGIFWHSYHSSNIHSAPCFGVLFEQCELLFALFIPMRYDHAVLISLYNLEDNFELHRVYVLDLTLTTANNAETYPLH